MTTLLSLKKQWQEESISQNRRSRSSPLPTNTARIHLQAERSSQVTYGTMAGELKHLEGQEKSLHNRVGWKRLKKKRQRRIRTRVPGRKLQERGGWCVWGSPLTSEQSSWDSKGTLDAQRKAQLLGQKEKWLFHIFQYIFQFFALSCH